MGRRGIWIIASIVVVAAAAALLIGSAIYSSSPAAYEHVVSQYLNAAALSDEETALALTSAGFVNELADIKLRPGAFRAYNFGFQGTVSSGSATMRIVIVGLENKKDSAYLADVVFTKSGFRPRLSAIRKISTGKPIAD